MAVHMAFLNTLNTVAFKGWSVVVLWIFTGLVWGVCAVLHVPMDVAIFTAWLAGLTAYSGVSAYQYGTMRNTDYGALERKANATQPTNVNVSATQANVAAGEVK